MEGPRSLPAPESRGGEDPDFSQILPGEALPAETVAELCASGYGVPGITTAVPADVSPAGEPWPRACDWLTS